MITRIFEKIGNLLTLVIFGEASLVVKLPKITKVRVRVWYQNEEGIYVECPEGYEVGSTWELDLEIRKTQMLRDVVLNCERTDTEAVYFDRLKKPRYRDLRELVKK